MADPVLLVDRLSVGTPQGDSGLLAKGGAGYLFGYHADAPRTAEVSLSMPHRMEQYSSAELHPIFQMNLPEGYVLERLRQRLAKAATMDPMLLLALTGRDAAIGRVHVQAPAEIVDALAPAERGGRGERLSQILAWDGAEDLFEELARRYLLRTGISGVQPKLLVPEACEPGGKFSLATSDLIVKSGGDEYPGLAVNEFVCMSIARDAGIPVPEFFLSDNLRLFVMRRFDRTAEGHALGFEEMAVLMARGAAQKYEGSYELVARFVEMYCSPARRLQALAQLFDQVALSCILGNGDAHLKNFGVLYADPTIDDVWLAPAYDLVNTTAYIPEDSLALALGGSRSLFASRVHLIDFAQRCRIADPRERVGELLAVTELGLTRHRALLEQEPVVEAGIRGASERFASGFVG